MRAYVSIRVRSGGEWELIRTLHGLEAVLRAHPTFGPHDVVAEIEART